RGSVGERFLVRNSGARAVVNAVGDHALEYMTGGTVVILGTTGRNLGAGMSGGTAYVLDLVPGRVNKEALASGELSLAELDESDKQVVFTLLQRFVEETQSVVAQEIINDWPAQSHRFTRVLPTQFARV